MVRKLLFFCAIAGGLAMHSTVVQAAPANDSIWSATPITTKTFSVQEDTTTATADYNYDPYCHGYYHSVWFAYTAQETGQINLSTIGSNYDTNLSVYTGSPGNLNQIACVDDTNGNQEKTSVNVLQGKLYYVMVGSYWKSNGGLLNFSITFTPANWHDWVSWDNSVLNYPECQYSGETLHCWIRSASGTLLWYRGNPRGEFYYTDLGGTVGGPPSCIVRATRIDCFVINSKAKLAQITYNGSSWGSWVTVGGAVFDRPSCLAINTNGIDCYVTGTDNGLYRFSFNGFWAPIKRIGTQATPSRPECVRRGTGTDCFVVDSNGNVKKVTIASNGTAGSYTQIGTNFAYAPQCVNTNSKLDCFGRSKDKQFYTGSFNGSTWSTWTKRGGSVETQPTCIRRTTTATPDFDCYWATPTNSLVLRQRVSGTWKSDQSLGGSVKARPSCVYLLGQRDCFLTGSDGVLKSKSFY